jgi:hypothetical protein
MFSIRMPALSCALQLHGVLLSQSAFRFRFGPYRRIKAISLALSDWMAAIHHLETVQVINARTL